MRLQILAEVGPQFEPNVSLDATLGAALIGHTVSLLLNGCTWLQVIVYFKQIHDRWNWLSTIVVILWVLNNIHVALVSEGLYVYLVMTHGNFSGILRPAWSFGAQVYVTILSNVIVRSVYAYRIWKLSLSDIIVDTSSPSKFETRLKYIIPVVIIILSLYCFGCGVLFGTIGVRTSSWLDNQTFSWSLYSSYGIEIVTDGIIAVSMSLILLHIRRQLRSTDSIVQRFIVYSVYTGVLTMICVALTLVSYIAYPGSFVYLAFYFVFNKLYVLSLIGSLTAPVELAEQHNPAQSPPQILTTAILIQTDAEYSAERSGSHRESLRDVEEGRTQTSSWLAEMQMVESGRGIALSVLTTERRHEMSSPNQDERTTEEADSRVPSFQELQDPRSGREPLTKRRSR